MGKGSKKPITLILALVIFVLGWTMRAGALEPTLKWKKEFKYEITSVDLAIETGDVILALNGREMRKRRNLFIIINYIECNSGEILIKDTIKNLKAKNMKLKIFI